MEAISSVKVKLCADVIVISIDSAIFIWTKFRVYPKNWQMLTPDLVKVSVISFIFINK